MFIILIYRDVLRIATLLIVISDTNYWLINRRKLSYTRSYYDVSNLSKFWHTPLFGNVIAFILNGVIRDRLELSALTNQNIIDPSQRDTYHFGRKQPSVVDILSSRQSCLYRNEFAFIITIPAIAEPQRITPEFPSRARVRESWRFDSFVNKVLPSTSLSRLLESFQRW